MHDQINDQKNDRKTEFYAQDVAFIRVLEDLVDALIKKGVVMLTDLPEAAQKKLSERKGLRCRLSEDLNLLDDHETLF